jgi:hypothetical protein
MIYLRAITSYFPPNYICKYADEILAEIKHFDLNERLELVKALGKSLIKSKPRRSALKLSYLNYAWEQLAQV